MPTAWLIVWVQFRVCGGSICDRHLNCLGLVQPEFANPARSDIK